MTGTASAPARARDVLVAAVLAVALLAADVVVVVRRRSGDGASIRRAVRELEAFVAGARGLPFRHPVDVDLLDDAAFRRRVVEGLEGETYEGELRDTVGFLRALGLLPPGVDLGSSMRSLLGAGVAGYYDPEDRTLVVRGSSVTPHVRLVLVHELTHALQDQHFDLDRPGLEDRRDESVVGLEALAEGDAQRVETLYLRSLSDRQRRAVRAEAERRSPPPDRDIPPVLYALFDFPYAVGPGVVRALLRDGGQARLDAAFRRPPSTSEGLIHPERYLAGEPARPVTAPDHGDDPFDRGVFGEVGLSLLLGDTLPDDQAARAAEGWGGDRFVAWRERGRACVRIHVVADTPVDRDELLAGLRQWARRQGSARVTREDDTIRVTACEGEAPPPTEPGEEILA